MLKDNIIIKIAQIRPYNLTVILSGFAIAFFAGVGCDNSKDTKEKSFDNQFQEFSQENPDYSQHLIDIRNEVDELNSPVKDSSNFQLLSSHMRQLTESQVSILEPMTGDIMYYHLPEWHELAEDIKGEDKEDEQFVPGYLRQGYGLGLDNLQSNFSRLNDKRVTNATAIAELEKTLAALEAETKNQEDILNKRDQRLISMKGALQSATANVVNAGVKANEKLETFNATISKLEEKMIQVEGNFAKLSKIIDPIVKEARPIIRKIEAEYFANPPEQLSRDITNISLALTEQNEELQDQTKRVNGLTSSSAEDGIIGTNKLFNDLRVLENQFDTTMETYKRVIRIKNGKFREFPFEDQYPQFSELNDLDWLNAMSLTFNQDVARIEALQKDSVYLDNIDKISEAEERLKNLATELEADTVELNLLVLNLDLINQTLEQLLDKDGIN